MAGSGTPLVLRADYDRLAAELEDTQESLIAALARIEAFRLRERVIALELARLRAGEQPEASALGADIATAAGRAAAAAPSTTSQAGAAGTAAYQPAPKEQRPVSDRPSYITDIGDQVPVLLLSGGRKVSAMRPTVRTLHRSGSNSTVLRYLPATTSAALCRIQHA